MVGRAVTARPCIIVVDLEATGFDPSRDAPVEIGRCDVYGASDLTGMPDFALGVEIGRPLAWLVDPGRPIPPETSAVHHIVDDDIRNAEAAPWRSEMIRSIGGISRPVAFAAHSAKMERGWCTEDLVGPAPWLCTYKCALRAWPDAPGHGNQALRYWLKPEGLDRELASPAHRAGPDAYVTAFLLRELLRLHPLDTLLRWSAEPAVLTRVPFGRRPEEGGSRGMKWTEIEDGLLRWVLERDMGEDVNHTARIELARREDERRQGRETEGA